MSLKTWKKEFYVIPASKCPRNMAIHHSLKKWIGLRAKNLEKHGMKKHTMLFIISEAEIKENFKGRGWFRISSRSCALCHYFMDTDDCPITVDFPCFGDCALAYNVWVEEGDPEPMISKLKKALKSA